MNYLEQWIHQIAGIVLGKASAARRDLDEYRLLRLRQTLRYIGEKSAFYRRIFAETGISPNDLRELDDLNRFPLTDPSQLSQSPYLFLCVSQSEVARLHTFVTTGTTGPQKKVFWSSGDLDRIVQFMAAGIGTVAGPQDVVQIMLTDGRPYSQADLLYRGVQQIKGKPVLAGPDSTPEQTLEVIRSFHPSVLFGYTGRIFRISRKLAQKHDLRSLGVKTLFLAGEYVPHAVRQELETTWDCQVRTHYGLTEMGLGVAVECEAGDGYHFNEAGLLLEVVDPVTGKTLPPGEEGELVFTTLTREAMPLLRYRTHDISKIIPGPCPCGSTSLIKIESVRKRTENIVQLQGGRQIYPSLFDDIIFEVPGILDYQVVLERFEGKVRVRLAVESVSSSPDTVRILAAKLTSMPEIAGEIASQTMAPPLVELAPADSLRLGARAKKMIVQTE